MNSDSNQTQPTATSFFGALFDLSFSSFITPKIIKILFILAMIGAAILSLVIIVGGFTQGVGAGILALILSVIVFVINIVLARLWLELVMVAFSINDRLKSIDGKTKF